MRKFRAVSRIGIAAAILMAAACGGPSGTPQRLIITGAAATIVVGTTAHLGALLQLSDNSTKSVASDVTWASANPAAVSVSPDGVLRAEAPGSAVIMATYLGLTAQAQTVSVAATPTSLRVTGIPSLVNLGQVGQLSALAAFNDGTTRDVTASAQWTTSDTTVVTVLAPGQVMTSGFGVATIAATFGSLRATTSVTVTPAGTFVGTGRVHIPGEGGSGAQLGLPDFRVTNTASGASMLTDSTGHYTIVGLTNGLVLVYDKDGFEPATLTVTSSVVDVPVQRVVRFNAGDSVVTSVAPNDVGYDLTPNLHCEPCHVLRVVSPAAGMLHVQVSWTGGRTSATVFFGGVSVGIPGAPFNLTADIGVQAGENLLFLQVQGGLSAIPVNVKTTQVASERCSSCGPFPPLGE